MGNFAQNLNLGKRVLPRPKQNVLQGFIQDFKYIERYIFVRATVEYSPHSLVLLEDYRNPNHYLNT